MVATSWPGGAEIITKDGKSFVKRFTAHKGEIHNPLTTPELEDKFRVMAAGYDSVKVEQIIQVISQLEDVKDIQELTNLL